MHLLLRKSAEKVRDILVSYLQSLLHGFTLNHFGKGAARCYCATASEGLKPCIHDATGIRVNFQIELQSVTACNGPYFSHRVGIFHLADVPWMKKMIFHLFSVLPHNTPQFLDVFSREREGIKHVYLLQGFPDRDYTYFR